METVLSEGIDSMPVGWRLWIYWLMAVNMASILFILRREGLITLLVWIANVVTMTLMAEYFGFVRLLGLSHLVWWIPLLIYLARRLRDIPLRTWLGRWIVVLMLTNSVSLVFDSIDVAGYLAGDRDDLRPSVDGPRVLESSGIQDEARASGSWPDSTTTPVVRRTSMIQSGLNNSVSEITSKVI